MGDKSPRIPEPWWSPAPWWTTKQKQWWETKFQKSRNPGNKSRTRRDTMKGNKSPRIPEPWWSPETLMDHRKKHNDGRQGSKSPGTRETSPGTRETSPGTPAHPRSSERMPGTSPLLPEIETQQVRNPGDKSEPCASSELGAHARYQSPATRDWNPKAYCCWEKF